MDRISVIIPNYNRSAVIGTTIENMLGQTVPPHEVIVVDDGSSDRSVAVVRSFGDQVKLIEQPNQGPGAARNQGLAAASGDYIQFMDSDDLASLNKLEVQLACLKASGADFAYCPWVHTAMESKPFRFVGPVLQGSALPAWKSMLEWQMGTWCIIFQNCLFRRSALEVAGAYRSDMRIAEDGEYLVRILLSGAQIAYTEDCLVFYRTDGRDHISGFSGSANSRRQQAANLTQYFEQIGVHVCDRLAKMHPSARREAALKVYRHNLYCEHNGWPTVGKHNSLCQLMATYPPGYLRTIDVWERVLRKIARASHAVPMSAGLAVRSPTQTDSAYLRQVEIAASKPVPASSNK